LSDDNLKELQEKIRIESNKLKGNVFMYDIISMIKLYLQAHNQKPQSFYDEMVEREKEKKKKKKIII